MKKSNEISLNLINVNDIASVSICLISDDDEYDRMINTIYALSQDSYPGIKSQMNNRLLVINLMAFVDEENKKLKDVYTIDSFLEKLVVIDVWLPNLYVNLKEIGIENLSDEEKHVLALISFITQSSQKNLEIELVKNIIYDYIDEYLM